MIDELKEYCEEYLKSYNEYEKTKYLSKYSDDLEKRLYEKYDDCVNEMINIGIFLGLLDD